MKKVLFVATVDSHIASFHVPYLEWFGRQGCEVHVASNGGTDVPFADVKYNIPFERAPFRIANLRAYKQLKTIIGNNRYDLIHCHTPVGALLTRLAARNVRKNGTKVIYTAHGFHFFKGAPPISWLLYYPVEKWLSRYTDVLITINAEDYESAHNGRFKAQKILMVNGVGVDLERYRPQTKEKKENLREQYGYANRDFILVYVAELSRRKHQDLLIDSVYLLSRKIPQVKLILVGSGDLMESYKTRVEKLGIDDHVEFLGYRKDIPNLLTMADVAVSSSRQEGLPVNVMEAMATGLPLVVTDCRGNRDLVKHGENGYVVGVDDKESLADAVYGLYQSEELRAAFGQRNLELIKKFSLSTVGEEMAQIYSAILY